MNKYEDKLQIKGQISTSKKIKSFSRQTVKKLPIDIQFCKSGWSFQAQLVQCFKIMFVNKLGFFGGDEIPKTVHMGPKSP